jgi:hypothetical protein
LNLQHIDRAAAGGPDKKEKLGLFSRDIKTMDGLFVHTLRDISAVSTTLCKTKPGADEAIELLMLRSDIRSQASPCGTGLS